MKHIVITKDNLIAFGKDSICILVPELILDKEIKLTNSFTGNTKIIKKVMGKHQPKKIREISDVMRADQWARKEAGKLCAKQQN